jgi:L-alanine-DL-glutamate epimerase-like enolase superfamily enzyme
MRIVEIHERAVPIASPMRNAYIDFSQMSASIVAIVTDVVRDGRPVVGFGFNSNGRYAASGLLRERFIPRLLNAPAADLLTDDGTNLDPGRAWSIMMANEKPGGHGERSVAVGTLDMALWDIVAKVEERPLYRVLADRYRQGEADETVSVYAAGGYYDPGKSVAMLQDEMRRYLDLGYTVVKLKIGGASLDEDIARIEAVLAVTGDGPSVAVDANGRFDLATALAYADRLRPYNLHWYEEAGDPLDYHLQATLAETYPPPLATGENLFSVQDVRNLLRYGGLRPDRDILQVDCALSYGLVEYLRILHLLRDFGWSWRRCIPHGGHQLSLHLAAGLGLGGNESYPGVFQPFGGFADGVPIEQGYVRLPDVPGIGFEAKAELYQLFRSLYAA